MSAIFYRNCVYNIQPNSDENFMFKFNLANLKLKIYFIINRICEAVTFFSILQNPRKKPLNTSQFTPGKDLRRQSICVIYYL